MAEKVKKLRLAESDWDVLFKKTEYTIGTTTFAIKPLALEELVDVLNVFKNFQQTGVTKMTSVQDIKDLLGTPQQDGVALRILKSVPEVLSIMSGIDLADLKRLPPLEGIKLFNACLDVNLESQEELTKNLSQLAEKMGQLTQGNQAMVPDSDTQSNS